MFRFERHELEIVSESHFQSECGIVAVFFKRLLVIDSGFDREIPVEEEGISHFHARHHIVVIIIGVYILHISAEIDTVLEDVIASAHAQRERVGLLSVVLVPEVTIELDIVEDEVSSFRLQSDFEVIESAVTEVQTGSRKSHILFSLFELCAGSDRNGQNGEQ